MALSVIVHGAFFAWPDSPPVDARSAPLQATIVELPPPPVPITVAKRATRPTPRLIAPPPVVVAEAVAETAPVAVAEASPPAPAIAEAPVPMPFVPTIDEAPVEAPLPSDIAPKPPERTLPPRVDLAYKVYFGTQGFEIGDATYRFEHTGSQYRIATVGEAHGLAALILRGQGRIESRGTITAAGLQPLQFAVERGGDRPRETALFDWEAGVVTLHEQNTVALELPTFDPLALMWQFYFAPPTGDLQEFNLATTRRMYRYTLAREGHDRIVWGGERDVDTERWHRRSDDGKTDAWFWLAPSMRYLPVKMRIVNTGRGTVEALLDSIRVDESATPCASPPPTDAACAVGQDAGPATATIVGNLARPASVTLDAAALRSRD